MTLQHIRTQPDPYQPYLLSQAVRVGGLLFVSGQAGYDDSGAIVDPVDFDRQAAQAFRNLRRALEAGGSDLAHVVKVTIFLTSMAHFPRIVELRKEHFVAPYPADTIVEVKALYTPEAMIEIEAVAVVREAAE